MLNALRARAAARPGASCTRLVALGVTVAFVGLLAYGLTTKATNATLDEALSRGRALPAPRLELDTLARGRPGPLSRVWDAASGDGRVSLEELRGTPLVLNFWASWCDPCRAEAPRLERGWQQGRRLGVLFLGLDQQDVREDALSFLDDFGITFPQIRDPSNSTAREWGVTGIPETFFISRRGDVVGHIVGVVSDEQLRAGIAAAHDGRPVGVRTGGERRPSR